MRIIKNIFKWFWCTCGETIGNIFAVICVAYLVFSIFAGLLYSMLLILNEEAVSLKSIVYFIPGIILFIAVILFSVIDWMIRRKDDIAKWWDKMKNEDYGC